MLELSVQSSNTYVLPGAEHEELSKAAADRIRRASSIYVMHVAQGTRRGMHVLVKVAQFVGKPNIGVDVAAVKGPCISGFAG